MDKPKVKINKPANNIMWVECWVQRVNPSLSFQISAEPNKDKWVSEFVLPVVNKEISTTGITEVETMLKAGNQAKKAIKEYIKSHPEYDNLVEPYWCHNWEIKEDDEGHFLGLGRSTKVRKMEGLEQAEKIGATGRAIQNALNKISKVYGSSRGFFIHVIDKNAIDENVDIIDYEQEILENYIERYNLKEENLRWSSARLTDDNIILIFYVDPNSIDNMNSTGNIN